MVGGLLSVIHGAFLRSWLAELVSVLVSQVMMEVLVAVMIFLQQGAEYPSKDGDWSLFLILKRRLKNTYG